MSRAMNWAKAKSRDDMRSGSYDHPKLPPKIRTGSLPATDKQLYYMKLLASRAGIDLPLSPISRNTAREWITRAKVDQTTRGHPSA